MRLTSPRNYIMMTTVMQRVQGVKEGKPHMVPAVKAAFPHRFKAKDGAVEWCEENLGENGYRQWSENQTTPLGTKTVLHYAVDRSCRWMHQGMTIYIADDTDAVAFKLVFG